MNAECQAALREAAVGFRAALGAQVSRPMKLMEVCGTHSQAIAQFGIKGLLPPEVKMISGPGCPVCVTPPGEIDAIIRLARHEGVTMCTFGDMMRVPGSAAAARDAAAAEGSVTLSREKALGADVRVIYSPAQAVELAAELPEREVVLVGVGFETTAPTIAAAVLEAERRDLPNFSVFALHRLVPPALAALLESGEVEIDGLLCPGHVSTIIGSAAYEPLAEAYHMPCVIAGFAATDVMAGVLRLAQQVRAGRAEVENVYGRSVRPEGNRKAIELMYTVFATTTGTWRGVGEIPGSGLGFREAYRRFDAVARLGVEVWPVPEPTGCLCGAVLKGALSPPECPSFGSRCTTEHPIGPCMVSSEGSCAAAYRYGTGDESGE